LSIYVSKTTIPIQSTKKRRNSWKIPKVSVELENGIYNGIYTFFPRYYDNGNFMGKRRCGTIIKVEGSIILLKHAFSIYSRICIAIAK
jgi:hypothetical protein